MSANRQDIGSDLAKVDAHEIRADEYDDAPEFTDEMFDRGKWSEGGNPIPTPKRRGRPPSDAPKVHVTARFDADVVEHFKAAGRGWQARMNDALRGHLMARHSATELPATRSGYRPPKPSKATATEPEHREQVARASASVPYAGDIKRGPMQKTGKRKA